MAKLMPTPTTMPTSAMKSTAAHFLEMRSSRLGDDGVEEGREEDVELNGANVCLREEKL